MRHGNESRGVHSAETLWRLLDQRLPADAQPWCIRGDISYSNETVISGCESRRRDYLFTVKKSGKIKALIHEFDNGDHVWSDAGQGWQGRESRAQWLGWSGERRLVILRRHHAGKDKKTPLISQQQSGFIAELCPDDGFEYAVLITSLIHPIATSAQFYRARADSENTFADLKHDWAWGGFTTHTNAQSLREEVGNCVFQDEHRSPHVHRGLQRLHLRLINHHIASACAYRLAGETNVTGAFWEPMPLTWGYRFEVFLTT